MVAVENGHFLLVSRGTYHWHTNRHFSQLLYIMKLMNQVSKKMWNMSLQRGNKHASNKPSVQISCITGNNRGNVSKRVLLRAIKTLGANWVPSAK
jgi:hypothetical protein